MLIDMQAKLLPRYEKKRRKEKVISFTILEKRLQKTYGGKETKKDKINRHLNR